MSARFWLFDRLIQGLDHRERTQILLAFALYHSKYHPDSHKSSARSIFFEKFALLYLFRSGSPQPGTAFFWGTVTPITPYP